jgi:hypothetical protein
MKKTILAMLLGAGVMSGLMVWANRTRHAPVADEVLPADAAPSSPEPAPAFSRTHDQSPDAGADSNKVRIHAPARVQAVAPDPEAAAKIAFKQAMDILVSPQSTHEQRQAAWKQLMDAGQLYQAVAQLQQLAAANPQSSEYADDLGEAYLKQCAMTNDIRAQGILALNADLLFDTALNLDSANWEARYTKAVAMSHWPASLNKGPDVVDNFLTLIQQQQTMTPQTQFALPYLRLGDQYQKSGDTASALNAWQQGAALYPANEDLKDRLTKAQ